MAKIKLYCYVFDKNHKELSQINPFIINAHLNNTILNIKEEIYKTIHFPIANQLIIFNNAVQPDGAALLHCSPDQAPVVLDGREIFLYLLYKEEIERKSYIAHDIGEAILTHSNLMTKLLNIELNIKPNPDTKNTPPRRSEGQSNAPQLTGSWNCKLCTYLNNINSFSCELCSEPMGDLT